MHDLFLRCDWQWALELLSMAIGVVFSLLGANAWLDGWHLSWAIACWVLSVTFWLRLPLWWLVYRLQ